MNEARGVVDEARILAEFRPSHDFAELDPMVIEPREDKDVGLPALDHAGRQKRRIMLSGAERFFGAAARADRLYAPVVVVEVRVEQRNIEVLTRAGAVAIKE